MARRKLIFGGVAVRMLRTKCMLHTVRLGILAAGAAVFFGCSTYPVDTTGRDLLELETVWQYLKAYSIWQDSIPLPPNAFTYDTPDSLLASVNDTLHGHSYTGYTDALPGPPRTGTASLGDAGTLAASDSGPIYYGAVSPRTAYLQIATFDNDQLLDSFLVALPFLSRYANIMLDLRGDGGGSIAFMDSIIEYFLPVNTPFITATYRSYNSGTRTASTVHNEHWTTKHAHSPTLAGKNIVILLNRGSASASEMLAAGIKDGRESAGLSPCLFVGDTSYGKGIGQVLINRAWLSRRDLSITYLRVVRECSCADSVYHRKGLAPDVRVTNANETIADSLQFLAAFHVLEPGVLPKKIPVDKSRSNGLPTSGDCVIQSISDFEK
jgi:Peptidase family S41